jgi:hypothetical protein
MRWVGWVLDALVSGRLEVDGDEPFDEAARRAVDSLEEFDRALDDAGRDLDRGRPTQRSLRGRLAELARATSDEVGRMVLALSRARREGRPESDDPPPEYFEDWFPLLRRAARRYGDVELTVHILAAEIRARRARSIVGVSRPQDFHVVLLLLREALRGPKARAAYVLLARGEFPRDAASMPVAANAIKSAFRASPSRRVYRCQEIALALQEASAEDVEEAEQLGRQRRLNAVRLDRVADGLAADYYDAQRAAQQARRCRDTLSEARSPSETEALARRALEAALSVSSIAARAGASSRERSIQRRLDAIEEASEPLGLDEASENARFAAGACKRMASELKSVATEAAAAAAASESTFTGFPPPPASLRLGGLREAMHIP